MGIHYFSLLSFLQAMLFDFLLQRSISKIASTSSWITLLKENVFSQFKIPFLVNEMLGMFIKANRVKIFFLFLQNTV